jgi:hypothetical protein
MNKSTIENLFYIDNIEGYNMALKLYNPKKDLLVCDNPFLANDPVTNKSIIDISKLLSQEDGNKIGETILLMSNEIENIFIKNNYKSIFNYYSNKIGIYLAIRGMTNTVIEKSLIFQYFLKNTYIKKLHLIINKSDYYDKNHPWGFTRFTNIYKFLAENNFFGNIPFDIIELDTNFPKNINDTREKNIILRIITWPLSYILYKGLSFINIFSFQKKDVFFIKKCETLTETLARLFFKGCKIKAIKLPEPKKYKYDLYETEKTIISKDIDSVLTKYLLLFNFTELETVSQKIIIIDHILLGMVKLKIDSAIYADYFSKLGSIKYILTAGFYGPIANQLFYLCNKYKISLIGFEHGVTAGINKDTSTYIENLESTTCNLLMVSNHAAKKEFDKANQVHKDSKNNKVYIIGEAEQKKHIALYKLQRYILKKRYKIKKNVDTIVHVSGLIYSGNLKNSPTSPVNRHIFEREKGLLTKVYNNINKKVLYKKYPSQRLLYQPCYSKILNLSSNISMVDDADFRYMRTVADIIVTDSNYSTIGWCLVKEVPLVYLMTKQSNALISENVEKLFIDSFFVINIDQVGWEAELKDLLQFSKKELNQKWSHKKLKRDFLIKNYIHGPDGSSSLKAANYINNIR